MKINMNFTDYNSIICNENTLNEIQNNLIKNINLNNRFGEINTIAGVDLAYWHNNSKEMAVCCIIVIDYHTHKIIEKKYSYNAINFPYIAGYLSFRELPLILKTAEKLENIPDIFIFDGNGYLHPRHMGIATHASFFLNKPTIGVAKSYYKINNTNFIMPQNVDGAYTNIIINNVLYGRALRTIKDIKPLFISCGNYIDIDTTTSITMSLINKKEGHIPLPTRLADIETHIMRKNFKSV